MWIVTRQLHSQEGASGSIPACESVNHALIQQDTLITVLVVVNRSIYARGNIVFSETMIVAQ